MLLAVTFRLWDTDFWQHLAVGRAIWTLHGVPTTQLWRWPSYGAPDVNESWGFSLLIWPFWQLGGVYGLFAWRWDMRGIYEGYQYFERKWKLDITESGTFREFLLRYNAQLGLIPRLMPTELP